MDLLLAMGYGGSRREAGQQLGQTGDKGIDGVMHEDLPGDRSYRDRAKRWTADQTVGAFHGIHASKGVFITTSGFSRGAREYAESVSSRIVLIDGRRLTDLMIAHGVGVTVRQRYELKRLDADYFEEDTL